MIIAPLSANTLAKIANGLSDNLVSLVCRCWNMNIRKSEVKNCDKSKENEGVRKLVNPLLVCPAMNTMMWDHPITEEQITKLRTWGLTIVDPIAKVLMCGDSGKGAMADLPTIVESLFSELSHL